MTSYLSNVQRGLHKCDFSLQILLLKVPGDTFHSESRGKKLVFPDVPYGSSLHQIIRMIQFTSALAVRKFSAKLNGKVQLILCCAFWKPPLSLPLKSLETTNKEKHEGWGETR